MRPTIATILALAALSLAPAPAAAVINNPGANCIPPNPGDQVFWNNGSWCQVQEGQGGPAGTGSAAGAASGGGATIYWASSDAPRDPVVECMRQNAGTCMPVQRGGRDVLESKNGTIAGQRGGGGSRAAGKSETGRGKKDELTKGLCKKLEGEGGTLLPSAARDLAQIRRELDALRSKTLGLVTREGELLRRMHVLEDRLARLKWALGKDSADRHALVFEYEDDILDLQKQIDAAVAERESLYPSIDALRAREAKALVDGAREARTALRDCGAQFGGRR
jgi:hypothetical protein